MAHKRHSPESIGAVLRKAESGLPIAELARKTGVHENTTHLWEKKYAQLGTLEIREISELHDENRRLALGERGAAHKESASPSALSL